MVKQYDGYVVGYQITTPSPALQGEDLPVLAYSFYLDYQPFLLTFRFHPYLWKNEEDWKMTSLFSIQL